MAKRAKANSAKATTRSSTSADVVIGEKIRTRRTIAGMSQSELGGQLGVSFQQIQKYEKGTNRVSAARLQEIASVLDESLSYFQSDGKAISASGREIHTLLSDRLNLRMCRALNRLEDDTMKQQLVRLCERVAGVHEDDEE